MKLTALILAIISATSGIFAAYKWHAASRARFEPFEEKNGRLVEVPTSDTQTWIEALRLTLRKSGRLNKSAALWTAVSVAFAGLSAFAGAWPSSN